MTGIHCLQQVECFGAADLADDDAFRPHAQAVPNQVAHGYLTLAFEIGRTGLEPHHMRLLQLQLGRILAGDDPFVLVDVARKRVEKRRLA